MKILVVRYRFIGDMILTVPFLRNLRYKYPDAQIDMLVAPNSGEVIENCPYVNNFIYFDTTRKHKYENGQGNTKSFWYYVKMLRKEKYDKAYVLKRSFSSALLCLLAGIKERVGFDTEHRGFLLTKKVKYSLKKHESLCFLDVLNADGIEVKDRYLENWIRNETKNKVKQLLLKSGLGEDEPFVVINVAASNPCKMWGLYNFSQIVQYLSNEKRIRVVYIGAPSDKELYAKMANMIPKGTPTELIRGFDTKEKLYHDRIEFKSIEEKKAAMRKTANDILNIQPINLCGKVTIKDSLAVIKEAEFLIGNDSGTLHMASSVGTRVIGLYGPMPFKKWLALGGNNILLKADLPCMPCSLKEKCPHDKACMRAITVEQVKAAIDKIMQS